MFRMDLEYVVLTGENLMSIYFGIMVLILFGQFVNPVGGKGMCKREGMVVRFFSPLHTIHYIRKHDNLM